jgi:aspartate aminotransferase
MKLSHLAETLIGSEIVKLGGEIREKIRQGEKIYNFTVGDFDPSIFPIPKDLEEEIVAAYRAHFTNYPAADGNLDLREALSKFMQKRQGLAYAPSDFLVSAGGRPLIYAFFRAIVDPHDKVIYAVPSWNNNHYAHFVDAKHVVVEATAENKFMPTAAQLAPHIADAVVLALCSPQNPTGTTYSKEALTEICDLVIAENNRRGDKKKLYVLYDQMYWHLTFGEVKHHDPVSVRPAMRAYTVYVDAISKVFAATGVRVGWSFGPAELIKKMTSILSHVGAWAPMAEQKATAKFLYNDVAIDAYLKHFRAEIYERLTAIFEGIQALKKKGYAVEAVVPEAAIYLTIQFDLTGNKTPDGNTLATQSDVTDYLLNAGKIAVVPFYAFGASRNSSWYRLSVGTCKKEEINQMLSTLEQALQQLV